MNDKKRFGLALVVDLLLIQTIIVLAVTFFAKNKNIHGIITTAIAALVSVVAVIYLMKMYKDVRTNQPIEDERSKKIKITAGYYSYLISLYIWLAILFMSNHIDNIRPLISAGILGMILSFFGTWGVLNSRKIPRRPSPNRSELNILPVKTLTTFSAQLGSCSITGAFVNDNIRESVRDTLYTNRVNPIAFFNGSGILNYGNKTRAGTTSALDRINVARLVGYLRRQLQTIATGYVFEPNDKITRDELKQQIEQTLNDLVAKRGVYDYLVVCDDTNNTPGRIDRNELYVDVAIEPTKAAEFIFIPIRLKNTGEIASGNVAAASTV